MEPELREVFETVRDNLQRIVEQLWAEDLVWVAGQVESQIKLIDAALDETPGVLSLGKAEEGLGRWQRGGMTPLERLFAEGKHTSKWLKEGEAPIPPPVRGWHCIGKLREATASAYDVIFEQLGEEILSGKFPPSWDGPTMEDRIKAKPEKRETDE